MNRAAIKIAIKQIFRLISPTAFSIFLIASIGLAQSSTSVLQGVVTDENEAIIPEVKIVLRAENGTERQTISDADGVFSFGALPFGKYRLTVEKEGFAVFKREITLNAINENSDLVLAAGGASESVTIVLDGAAAAVESTLKLPVSIHETPQRNRYR
jgi:hypothetical protein